MRDFHKRVSEVVGTAVTAKFNGLSARSARTLEYYGVEDGSTITVEKLNYEESV